MQLYYTGTTNPILIVKAPTLDAEFSARTVVGLLWLLQMIWQCTSVMSVLSRLVLWLALLLAVFRGCSIMAIVKPMVRSPMVKETVGLLVERAAKVI